MSDIVEKLRNAAYVMFNSGYQTRTLAKQAADEIERLTASRDGYVKQRNALQEECDRLRASLASARREALEEAAAYHDDMAAQHDAAHGTVESEHHMMMARQHRRDAAAIRALMEKPE